LVGDYSAVRALDSSGNTTAVGTPFDIIHFVYSFLSFFFFFSSGYVAPEVLDGAKLLFVILGCNFNLFFCGSGFHVPVICFPMVASCTVE
jgi:hypothetical protein